jgi:hypothetical protein
VRTSTLVVAPIIAIVFAALVGLSMNRQAEAEFVAAAARDAAIEVELELELGTEGPTDWGDFFNHR